MAAAGADLIAPIIEALQAADPLLAYSIVSGAPASAIAGPQGLALAQHLLSQQYFGAALWILAHSNESDESFMHLAFSFAHTPNAFSAPEAGPLVPLMVSKLAFNLESAATIDTRLPALAGFLLRLPRSNQLTKAHVDFMRVAVARKAFDTARLVADVPMFTLATFPEQRKSAAEAAKDLGGVTSVDVLTYYFCSGSVFCFHQLWAKAAAAFKTVGAPVLDSSQWFSTRSRRMPLRAHTALHLNGDDVDSPSPSPSIPHCLPPLAVLGAPYSRRISAAG